MSYPYYYGRGLGPNTSPFCRWYPEMPRGWWMTQQTQIPQRPIEPVNQAYPQFTDQYLTPGQLPQDSFYQSQPFQVQPRTPPQTPISPQPQIAYPQRFQPQTSYVQGLQRNYGMGFGMGAQRRWGARRRFDYQGQYNQY